MDPLMGEEEEAKADTATLLHDPFGKYKPWSTRKASDKIVPPQMCVVLSTGIFLIFVPTVYIAAVPLV